MPVASPTYWFAAIHDQRFVTRLCGVVGGGWRGEGVLHKFPCVLQKPSVALLVSGVPVPSSGTYSKAGWHEVIYLVLGSDSPSESLRKQQNVRAGPLQTY